MGADASRLQEQHRSHTKPPLQHSLSLDLPVPPHPSLAASEAGTPSKPVKVCHYSDFSLFPDRFSAPPKTGNKSEAMAISKSAHEGGFLEVVEGSNAMSTSVSNPAGLAGRVGHFSNQHSASEQKADFEKFRRRVNSQGSSFSSASPSRDSSPKLPYFDFSLLPEKDPRSFGKKDAKKQSPMSSGRERLSSVGDDAMMGSSVEAHKLRVKEAASRSRKLSEPPKFSFFDYSLIPDKMDQPQQQHPSGSSGTSKAK